MAITYSAGAGTVITSAIVSETLGSQTGAPSDGVILATANITPSTHAGYGGNVGTNTDSFGPGDTYIKRLIAVRVGTATEEVKVCTAVVDNGATITLTVHEDWDLPPASGDVLHVAYTGDDIEHGGAGNGIDYGRKTAVWILSNDFWIGNGTDFAFFMLGTAEGLELDKTGVPCMTIRSNGLFQAGYLFAGTPVNGAYISVEEDTTGTLYWENLSGSFMRLYDTDLKFNIHTVQMDFQAGSDIVIKDMKNFNFTYDIQLMAGSYTDIKWTGISGTSEFCRIAEATIINGFNIISTAGFHTEDTDTTTETLTIRDCIFITNLTNITVNSNKTWDVINPTWTIDLTSQDDIKFLTATSNIVNNRRSLDVIVAEADGTLLANTRVILFEGNKWTTWPSGFVATNLLVIDEISDSIGEVASTWVYQDFIDAGPGTSLDDTIYGGHGLRVDNWLYTPFVAAQTSDEFFDGTTTLIPDGHISETTKATAITDGDTIGWWEETYPSEIIEYNTGTGTLAVGDTVTGGTSGASGVVTQIVSGNSTAGEVHLKSRNPTDFYGLGSETVSNGTGWSATHPLNVAPVKFDIWIDADNLSLQVIYDYLAARTSDPIASNVLFDSYPSSNFDSAQSISGYYAYTGQGQSFTTTAAFLLTKVSFFASGTGTPTGTVYARLYGTTPAGAPNGSHLAESSRLASSFTGGLSIEDFTFNYRLDANTTYVIALEYHVDGGSGNYFNAGTDNSSPTHPGTSYKLSKALGTWSSSSWDVLFYVYGEDEIGDDIHIWGRDQDGRALYFGADGYFTNRSVNQGVMIIDYGAGAVDYFTDNAGNTWTPPTSVTLTVTVKDEAGVAINLAQVGIYTPSSGTSDRTELMNKDTNASGIATESYTGTVPLGVEVRVRKASSGATKYKNFSSLQTISASGLTLAVTMQEDPNNNATS